MALWLAAELAPFVPSIDFQAFKDSVRPLLLSPRFDAIDFLRGFAGWMVFAFLARRSPGLGIPIERLLLIMATTMAAKIVIVHNSLSLSDVAGMAAAFCVIAYVDRTKTNLPRIVLGVLAGYFVISGLEPFSISAAGTFHWIPLAGSLGGSMLTNLQVMSAKIFFIGALFLISVHTGIGISRTAVVSVTGLLVLEILQLWVGNHTAEITDPLIAALIAAGLAVYQRRGGEFLPAAGETSAGPPIEDPGDDDRTPAPFVAGADAKRTCRACRGGSHCRAGHEHGAEPAKGPLQCTRTIRRRRFVVAAGILCAGDFRFRHGRNNCGAPRGPQSGSVARPSGIRHRRYLRHIPAFVGLRHIGESGGRRRRRRTRTSS